MNPHVPREALRDEDARVERLLREAEAAVGPAAWPRVANLVTALVELYGRCLGRVVGYARDAAASPEVLDERFASDELVASLLFLHELHAPAVEARLARALEEPRPAPGALVPVERLTRGGKR